VGLSSVVALVRLFRHLTDGNTMAIGHVQWWSIQKIKIKNISKHGAVHHWTYVCTRCCEWVYCVSYSLISWC